MNIIKIIKSFRLGKPPAQTGFSLIEMLIAVTLFAVIALITTQALATVLKNSKKSESISKARENVDFAMSTMERLLRNAQDITVCTNSQLGYIDEYGNTANFYCNPPGNPSGYIASGSARLTSTSVFINCTGVTFYCPGVAVGVPEAVEITVKGVDAVSGSGVEGAEVTQKTKILLRNYTVF